MDANTGSEAARAQWAARITGAWRKSVEAVLEAGRLLREAKDALPDGDHGDGGGLNLLVQRAAQ